MNDRPKKTREEKEVEEVGREKGRNGTSKRL